jgi:molecular chaperone GrpE
VTPEQIEAILADFRACLLEAAVAPEAPPDAEPVDLHTLVAQFTALRQEVNLQTRAVRLQQEQNSETLRQLEAAVRQPAPSSSCEDQIPPLLNALIDVADTQQRAAAELGRVAQTINTINEAEMERAERPRPLFFARLFGSRGPEPGIGGKALDRLRETIEAAVAGLEMGLQRIERAMTKVGLEPIAAAGRPFDPELMEAVEVAADSGQPTGKVVAELRRGYRYNGRVLRYAQVRVAK